MIDEFVYQYKDQFNYLDFLVNMAPLVQSNIQFPQEDVSEDPNPKYVEDSADYVPEIEEMFMHMGIGKLDGKRGFRFDKPMTCISCVVSYDGDNGIEYGRYYVDVYGTMIIEPEGYDPEKDTLTAIH